jgi:hypothetical protein
MAVRKSPWLALWITFEQAQAMAERIVRKRRRRDCVVTAWVESAYVGELRKGRCREPMIILDKSLPDDVKVYRAVVSQRLKRGHKHKRWSPRGMDRERVIKQCPLGKRTETAIRGGLMTWNG